MTQDGLQFSTRCKNSWLQFSSQCKNSFNIFLFKFFRGLEPKIGSGGSFKMSLVFFVLFWSLLFYLMMFLKCSVSMLVSGFLFCPVSVKMPIKNLVHSGNTFQGLFWMLVKENLWILPLRYLVLYLSLILCVYLLMFSRRFWSRTS